MLTIFGRKRNSLSVIQVNPNSDITDKVIQDINEDEDSTCVEILNSFEINQVNTYIVKTNVVFEDAENEKYYNLTPIALY